MAPLISLVIQAIVEVTPTVPQVPEKMVSHNGDVDAGDNDEGESDYDEVEYIE